MQPIENNRCDLYIRDNLLPGCVVFGYCYVAARLYVLMLEKVTLAAMGVDATIASEGLVLLTRQRWTYESRITLFDYL